MTLSITTTHKHPTLGVLTFKAVVFDTGILSLESVDFKCKPVSYGNWVRYTIYPYWAIHEWQVNFVKRRWQNGMFRDYPNFRTELGSDLLPVMNFVNSEAFDTIMRRALKKQARSLRRALKLLTPEAPNVR